MMVDKFNAENDAIEIVYDVVPGYGDRLTTSFSSGEGYNIFASGEGDFYKWVGTNLAAPMDDLMVSDGEWTKDFNESIQEMGQIQGKQYYIVRDYNPICLWCGISSACSRRQIPAVKTGWFCGHVCRRTGRRPRSKAHPYWTENCP